MKRLISLIMLAFCLNSAKALDYYEISTGVLYPGHLEGFTLPVALVGTNIFAGTLPFTAVDSGFASLVNGKLTLPMGGTSANWLHGDGSIGTIPTQSYSTSYVTNISSGSIYSNSSFGTLVISGSGTWAYGAVLGSTYLNCEISPSLSGPWINQWSVGKATVLGLVIPTEKNNFSIQVPYGWVFRLTNAVSGIGSSITLTGTNFVTAFP